MTRGQNKKGTNKLILLINPSICFGAHGANRTRDTWIRNPVLYPLSYAGRMLFAAGGIILELNENAISFRIKAEDCLFYTDSPSGTSLPV